MYCAIVVPYWVRVVIPNAEMWEPGQKRPSFVLDDVELRHPVCSRRKATISGTCGGVFCNLPDGTVCLYNYAYQYKDYNFIVGDTVILAVQRFGLKKNWMYKNPDQMAGEALH